jgi:hypothetical protein
MKTLPYRVWLFTSNIPAETPVLQVRPGTAAQIRGLTVGADQPTTLIFRLRGGPDLCTVEVGPERAIEMEWAELSKWPEIGPRDSLVVTQVGTAAAYVKGVVLWSKK